MASVVYEGLVQGWGLNGAAVWDYLGIPFAGGYSVHPPSHPPSGVAEGEVFFGLSGGVLGYTGEGTVTFVYDGYGPGRYDGTWSQGTCEDEEDPVEACLAFEPPCDIGNPDDPCTDLDELCGTVDDCLAREPPCDGGIENPCEPISSCVPVPECEDGEGPKSCIPDFGPVTDCLGNDEESDCIIAGGLPDCEDPEWEDLCELTV